MPSTVSLLSAPTRSIGPGGLTVAPHLGQTSSVSRCSPLGRVAITRSQFEHLSRVRTCASEMATSVPARRADIDGQAWDHAWSGDGTIAEKPCLLERLRS